MFHNEIKAEFEMKIQEDKGSSNLQKSFSERLFNLQKDRVRCKQV